MNMSEAGFTKGPWRASRWQPADAGGRVSFRVYSPTLLIAETAGELPVEIEEANAHLLASANDMRAAVLAYMSAVRVSSSREALMDALRQADTLALAAINKATGK